MQKRLWGVSAAALALTCLTVTGCGTAQDATPSTHSLATAQTTSSSNTKSQIASIVVSHSQIRTPINQPVRISGQALNSQHEVIPNAKLSVVGLPDSPSGYTVKTNTQGEFHLTTQWSHPGKYTIAIGDGKRSIDISVQVVNISISNNYLPKAKFEIASKSVIESSALSKKFNGTIGYLKHIFPFSFFYPNKTITLYRTGGPHFNGWHIPTHEIQLSEEFIGTVNGKNFVLLAGNIVQKCGSVGGVIIEYLNGDMVLQDNVINDPALDLFIRNNAIFGYQAGAHYDEFNLFTGKSVYSGGIVPSGE
ncbi:carboxypeptidase-like regulatory domain-containing protein [Alicyclobacillus sp. SP_1]|uniref:carboxypeptidase-like regulatory domain-containing protein n=1 Tax=Alicyclobacillus sp. SP_1 TaxID=2942475 RepID=UPI00215811FC|nr:carboxypeptidase-like regulatory domain-containing protein [Alicyclobacillus sp. SP_1]